MRRMFSKNQIEKLAKEVADTQIADASIGLEQLSDSDSRIGILVAEEGVVDVLETDEEDAGKVLRVNEDGVVEFNINYAGFDLDAIGDDIDGSGQVVPNKLPDEDIASLDAQDESTLIATLTKFIYRGYLETSGSILPLSYCYKSSLSFSAVFGQIGANIGLVYEFVLSLENHTITVEYIEL